MKSFFLIAAVLISAGDCANASIKKDALDKVKAIVIGHLDKSAFQCTEKNGKTFDIDLIKENIKSSQSGRIDRSSKSPKIYFTRRIDMSKSIEFEISVAPDKKSIADLNFRFIKRRLALSLEGSATKNQSSKTAETTTNQGSCTSATK